MKTVFRDTRPDDRLTAGQSVSLTDSTGHTKGWSSALHYCTACLACLYFQQFTYFQDRIYTVSQKNDNDVLRYNFNAHQPILIIFGRDIAE